MMMNYQYNSDVKESDCTPGFYQARYFENMPKTYYNYLQSTIKIYLIQPMSEEHKLQIEQVIFISLPIPLLFNLLKET